MQNSMPQNRYSARDLKGHMHYWACFLQFHFCPKFYKSTASDLKVSADEAKFNMSYKKHKSI